MHQEVVLMPKAMRRPHLGYVLTQKDILPDLLVHIRMLKERLQKLSEEALTLKGVIQKQKASILMQKDTFLVLLV